MARIPESEIERLKQEVSLERLVAAQGIELKRHGGDLLGLCPFHNDREPSLVVSPKKNLWHCLGACQTGGSVTDVPRQPDPYTPRSHEVLDSHPQHRSVASIPAATQDGGT